MQISDDLNNEFASPEHEERYKRRIQAWWDSLESKPIVVVLPQPITDWGL